MEETQLKEQRLMPSMSKVTNTFISNKEIILEQVGYFSVSEKIFLFLYALLELQNLILTTEEATYCDHFGLKRF